MKKILFVTLLLLTACSKNKEQETPLPPNNDPIPAVINAPGIGATKGIPAMTEFKLPPGYRFVSRPHLPFDPNLDKLKGSIPTFYVDIHIVTDISQEGRTITLPEALILRDTFPDPHYQFGLLLDSVDLPMPRMKAGAGGDTVTFYLGVACINMSKTLPWTDNEGLPDSNFPLLKGSHRVAGIVTNPSLLKFTAITRQFPGLALKHHFTPRGEMPDEDWVYDYLQGLIWEITDGDGIQQEELDDIWERLKPYK